jgi:hypothetical protein
VLRVHKPQHKIAILACGLLLSLLATQATAETALLGARADALEVFPYTGMVDRSPFGGDYKKQDAQMGYGMLVRVPEVGRFGTLEVTGFSDFRWTEVSIAKYHYIFGRPPQTDPASTKEMNITRIANWATTVSYGAGFFTQNTKTIRYNLPTLVTGGEAVLRILSTYAIDDHWSVGGLLSFAVAISTDDSNFNSGFGLAVGYRF